MPSFNKVILVGHMCADVEIRDAGSSTVGRIRLAVDDSYKSASGEKIERAVFVDVEAWGALADTTAKYTGKGSAILVEGKLQLDAWEDKETGQKRSKLKIRADAIKFITFKDKPEGGAAEITPGGEKSFADDGDSIPF